MNSKIWSIFQRYKNYNGLEFAVCTSKIKGPYSEARECGHPYSIGSEEKAEVDLKLHLYQNHFEDYRRIYPCGTKKSQKISKPQKGFIEPRKPQNYCLPTDVIRYITKTANPKLSWRLAHTAKALVNLKIFKIVDRLEFSDLAHQWKTFDYIYNHEEVFNPKTFEDKIVFFKSFRIQNSEGFHLQTFLPRLSTIFCFTEIQIARQIFSFEEYLTLTSTARHIFLLNVYIRNSELHVVPLEALLEPLTSRIITFTLINSRITYYTPQTFLKLSTMKFKKLQSFRFECSPLTLPPQLICNFIENNPTLTQVGLSLKFENSKANDSHQYINMWIDETYEKGFGPKFYNS